MQGVPKQHFAIAFLYLHMKRVGYKRRGRGRGRIRGMKRRGRRKDEERKRNLGGEWK